MVVYRDSDQGEVGVGVVDRFADVDPGAPQHDANGVFHGFA